jgi:hypothetical protein
MREQLVTSATWRRRLASRRRRCARSRPVDCRPPRSARSSASAMRSACRCTTWPPRGATTWPSRRSCSGTSRGRRLPPGRTCPSPGRLPGPHRQRPTRHGLPAQTSPSGCSAALAGQPRRHATPPQPRPHRPLATLGIRLGRNGQHARTTEPWVPRSGGHAWRVAVSLLPRWVLPTMGFARRLRRLGDHHLHNHAA